MAQLTTIKAHPTAGKEPKMAMPKMGGFAPKAVRSAEINAAEAKAAKLTIPKPKVLTKMRTALPGAVPPKPPMFGKKFTPPKPIVAPEVAKPKTPKGFVRSRKMAV